MTTNALSVDLEEYFQVSNFDAVIERSAWSAQPSRVRGQTERLLDLFDELGCRATFFVLGWIADSQPDLVRAVASRGHEIACHGFAHDLVYELDPERFRADLRRARAAIEDAAGERVHGYRAPSYSITRASLWALPILAEEGFRYDSSIFPIRHHRYGIPDFAARPVRIELGAGASIREFPPTTASLGPIALPLAGGAYLRFVPPALFRWAFGRLVRAGEPTLLYVHPWELDPGQPRHAVGWRVRLNHYHNLGRTERRLRALLARHAFAPVAEVLERLEVAGRLRPVSLPEPARSP